MANTGNTEISLHGVYHSVGAQYLCFTGGISPQWHLLVPSTDSSRSGPGIAGGYMCIFVQVHACMLEPQCWTCRNAYCLSLDRYSNDDITLGIVFVIRWYIDNWNFAFEHMANHAHDMCVRRRFYDVHI